MKRSYVKPINESYIMPVLAKVAIVDYAGKTAAQCPMMS